jgi:transcription elongation GreA/GreB family factor
MARRGKRSLVVPLLWQGAQVGDVVVFEAGGLEFVRRLFRQVPTGEVDWTEGGRLSVESPVGAALVGMLAGDVTQVYTPAGTVKVKMVRVLSRVRR